MTPEDLAATRRLMVSNDPSLLRKLIYDLLAEVGALRDIIDRLAAEYFSEAERLKALLIRTEAAERARIRAAVEGLPLVDVEDEDETGNGVTRLYLNVRDVLAAIDGTSTEGRSPTAESRRWEEE